MAMVGMLHPVAAKIATEVEGQALTYDAGMVVGKAISANITFNRNDNPLYADDAVADALAQSLASSEGFTLDKADTVLYGICADCEK